MADWTALATRLDKALHLGAPPIAITFSHEAPQGVAAFDEPFAEPSGDGRTGRVPAGCVFWMRAIDRTFTTVSADHGNCSVGQFTHGMIDHAEIVRRGDVATLLECGWVTEEMARQIPQVDTPPEFVTYGPLASTSVDPDVVLLRINGRQLMVMHDAFPGMRIEGKPQCHIVAIASKGELAASVGCALSRVRTGMSSSEMTCAIPASRLEEVVDALTSTDGTDDIVMRYAAEDSRRFAAM